MPFRPAIITRAFLSLSLSSIRPESVFLLSGRLGPIHLPRDRKTIKKEEEEKFFRLLFSSYPSTPESADYKSFVSFCFSLSLK